MRRCLGDLRLAQREVAVAHTNIGSALGKLLKPGVPQHRPVPGYGLASRRKSSSVFNRGCLVLRCPRLHVDKPLITVLAWVVMPTSYRGLSRYPHATYSSRVVSIWSRMLTTVLYDPTRRAGDAHQRGLLCNQSGYRGAFLPGDPTHSVN